MTDDGSETFENPVNEKLEDYDGDALSLSEPDDRMDRLRADAARAKDMAASAQFELEQRVKDLSKKDESIAKLTQTIVEEKQALVEQAQAELEKRGKVIDLQPQLHISSNTLGEIDSGILESLDALPKREREQLEYVWGLSFLLPPVEYELGVTADPKTRKVSLEAWALIHRIWACDLIVRYTITADNSDILIEIAAPHKTLVLTATDTRVGMRMMFTRGSLPFHEDLTQYFSQNHGGLNEWDAEKQRWKVRGKSAANEFMDSKKHLFEMSEYDLESELENHGITEEAIDEMGNPGTPELIAAMRKKLQKMRKAFDSEKTQTERNRIWTTGIKQRLVRHRLKALCGIDFEMRMHAKGPEEAIKWLQSHAVDDKRTVRAAKINELLTAIGGYRPNAQDVFPRGSPTTESLDGICTVHKLAQQCLVEPNFVLDPALGDEQPMSRKIRDTGMSPVTYSELCDALEVCKKWRDPVNGPGRDEEFVGTLLKYFPMHDKAEIQYLKDQWGKVRMLFTREIAAYAEGGNAVYSLGHPDNQIHEYTIPWVWTWQPIHEIRDYFGEDCALYYAWLGHYTSSLFVCMLFGCVTMALQYHYDGVENNPLTMAYSVYVGLWSVIFVEAWKRKETEYRFLWGSEVMDATEEIRPQFVGKRIITETGREQYIYKSSAGRLARNVTAFSIVWVMISVTVASALGASLIRALPTPGQSGYSGIFEENFKSVEDGGTGDPGPGGCIEEQSYHFEHPCGFIEQNCPRPPGAVKRP
jgi:hypothetical protein